MKPKVLRRKIGETDSNFADRAATTARKLGASVETPNGWLCATCAWSADLNGIDAVTICGPGATCYNCPEERKVR